MNYGRIQIVMLLLLGLPLGAIGQKASFSHPSGIYDTAFDLTVTMPEGYVARYTLNGGTPTGNDSLYRGSLHIDSSCLSRSCIYRNRCTPEELWYMPPDVERIVVVRVALFDGEGTRCGAVSTASYVVHSLLGRRCRLPVVSLCIDSAQLFNYANGIFATGAHFDNRNPLKTGNYFQKGRAWERAVHLDYIPPDGAGHSQDCGLRVHGNSQRPVAQKCLALYARKDYGDKRFGYRFFGEKKGTCRRLVLRPWGGSWSGAGIEDCLCQRMADPLRCDNLAARPVTLFINGEYWGIYFLEEKPDEHYVEDHYDVDDEDVDMVNLWGAELETGSRAEWDALYQWLETADLARDEDYAHLSSQVDIEALMDYMLLEVFTSNVDWPANNVRQWKAPGYRWRWIYYDGDASLAVWRENGEILEYLTCDDTLQQYPSSAKATLLFRRLLANWGFAMRSVWRLAELVNRHLGYSHTSPMLKAIVAEVEDEVPYQIARFGKPQTVEQWRERVDDIDRYLNQRTTSMVADYAALVGVSFDGSPQATIVPNPSSSRAVLRYSAPEGKPLEVEVYNLQGRCVYSMEYPNAAGASQVPLPPLPPGVYLLRIASVKEAVKWVIR